MKQEDAVENVPITDAKLEVLPLGHIKNRQELFMDETGNME